MKLTAFILTIVCFHVSASGFSQKMAISVKDVPIKTVFSLIEQRSSYKFFYDNKLIKNTKKVTVEFREASVEEILGEVMKDLPLSYQIVDKIIVIKKKENNSTGAVIEPVPKNTESKTSHIVSIFSDVDRKMTERLSGKAFNFQKTDLAVNGKVSDEKGNGLPGVSVLIKGTQRGTISDEQGAFNINVDDDNAVLVFSSVGYAAQEILVKGRTQINLVLREDSRSLDGVVVVGYTSQKKRDVTSAIAIADVESMQRKSVTDVGQALQGNAAGVNIAASNGNPGSEMHINIRGISSYSGSNAPLIIVDGVQVEGGLRELNGNDIKSIQVLKDASSAAIYGSRAANGVILVTTKKGERGASKAKVTYQNYVGVQVPYKGIDVANSQQYITILQSMYGQDLSAANLPPQAALDYIADPSKFKDYDWQKEIYKSAPLQSHDLSISGGGSSGTYRVSLGYVNQQGITLGTGFKRVNVRANSEFFVNDRITIGQSIALSKSATEEEPYAFSRSTYSQAIKMYPYFAPKLPNGDWQTSSFYYGGGDNPEALIRNPMHYKSIWDRDIADENMALNMYGELKIFNGLKYKLSGSFSQARNRMKNYFGDKGDFQDEYFDPNLSLEEATVTTYNWNIDNTLRYQKNLGKHMIDVTAGFISQKFSDRSLVGGKNGYLSDITGTIDGPGGKNPYIEGDLQESTLLSLIGQAFYSYDDKYLVTLNFRRDGSSRFGPDYRWGNFPGVSAGWRLSHENFWKNGGLVKAISDLKIRTGYGELGRQNLGNYDYTPVLQYIPTEFGGKVQDGLITGTPINEAISWERLISKTIGLDYELFNGKISGSFDYYNNDTKNMIIGLSIAPSVGGGELQSNAGRINNRGFEMTVDYNDKIGDLNYRVGFNLGTTRTRLIDIGRELEEGDSPEWDVPHAIEIHQGGGLAEYWLIKTNGIFKSQEEIENYKNADGRVIQPNAEPGDIRFVDADGDGEITSEGDRQRVGSGVPKVNLGFNLTANYKSFDMYLGMTGAFGQVIYNSPKYLIEQPYGYANFSTRLLDAFDPVNNPGSNFPRLNPNDVDDNWNSRPTSDRYIENGNYVKIRNVEFGYQIPVKGLKPIGLTSARVFARIQNLLNITGYSGSDPEVGSSPLINDNPIFTAGLDRDTAPQARSFQLGVNISF
ncbi:TonB-dependent receptor [Dyadobacter sp. NIV53]|uniref:TonB-dependent receptor n=1 Tax=Dyadobacter sp. NIV53 TaxID=2861765 RepID=UPI001C871098|nr:TonB-dependent receptor [Dyadobacter sp. NIV53]